MSKRGTRVDEDCHVPPGSLVGDPGKMYTSRRHDSWTEVSHDTSVTSHIVKVTDSKGSLSGHSGPQKHLRLLQVTLFSAPSPAAPL